LTHENKKSHTKKI